MPICKKCQKMQASAEMRETSRTARIDYLHRDGKLYGGLLTHWVCMDKFGCRDRVVELKREQEAKRLSGDARRVGA